MIAALALALLAGCAEERQTAVAPDAPDRAVQAPARVVAPPAGTPPRTCRRVARRLPGMELVRARALVHRRGCELRVIAVDGQALAVTEDLRRTRINVRMEDGRVSAVSGLY